MKNICALSYFHRKIGPLVFYSYPENMLDDQLSSRIANIMDQQFTEGFFTHSFKEIMTMNYYFEIQSDWARGNRDMLMISIIFNQQTKPETEEKVQNLCIDFSQKLKSNEEIYTAFHISDINNFEHAEQELILRNNDLVRYWVKELYWATVEVTREKTEEERLASILNKRHIFQALKKLTKGPLPLEWLKEWFQDEFEDKSFEEMINTLVDRQLIFINQIGIVEKYVLLLKEVNAERIPPDNIIEYIDEIPELVGLILPKVQKYFSLYEQKSEEELEKDSFLLFNIISDPKMYNVLSELRNSLIPRDKLPKLISKRYLTQLSRVLDYLKTHDIIEELKFENERYIVLKTNLQITTAFPEYLRKLLPRETLPVIANPFSLQIEEKEKQKEIAEILKDARKKQGKKTKEERITQFLENLASKSTQNKDIDTSEKNKKDSP